MEGEYGLKYVGSIAVPKAFNDDMEQGLPPTRCIEVVGQDWVGSKVFRKYSTVFDYSISPGMVESPAFTIGKEYEFSDDGEEWLKRKYGGYVHDNKYKYRGDDEGFRYCREIKQELDTTIEITVKINGKEAKLSDISDETLNKIKEIR
jgi:hypothetical protein